MRAIGVLLLLLALSAQKTNAAELFPFGTDVGDTKLTDASSSPITLKVPIKYFEDTQKTAFVSNNGVLSFDKPFDDLTDENIELKTVERTAIAAFFADTEGGNVYYREETSDEGLLTTTTELIKSTFQDATDFKALALFIATWDGVNPAQGAGANTYQIAIASDGDSSYVAIIYGNIEWTQSGEGQHAQGGFIAKDGRHQNLINSGTPGIKDLAALSNVVDKTGTFVFRISGSAPEDPRSVGTTEDEAQEDYDEEEYGDAPEGEANGPHPPEDVNTVEEDSLAEHAGAEESIAEPSPEPVEKDEEEESEAEPEPEPEAVDTSTTEEPVVTTETEDDEDEDGEPEVTDASENDIGETPVLAPPSKRPTPPKPEHSLSAEELSTPMTSLPEDADEQELEHRPDPPQIPIDEEQGPRRCSEIVADTDAACHRDGECVDLGHGYCCQCLPGYYGNGKECLKDGDPQRINGGFSGKINGHEIPQTELHTYVVTNDGRAYTALSQIPARLGRSLLLLEPVGGVMGWLFAKVESPAAYNGFQLTGGLFNRTVNLHIGEEHTVTITQEFSGRDIYHYFKAKVFVSGTLPELPEGVEVIYPDYQEEYRREGPGLLRSYSSQMVKVRTVEGEETQYRMTIDQQIRYKECSFRAFDKDSLVTLAVNQPHVIYDTAELIVRYASGNSVYGQRGAPQRRPHPEQTETVESDDTNDWDQQQEQLQQQREREQQHHGQHGQRGGDPCSTGEHYCKQPNMICTPFEPSYRCECERGYEVQIDASVQPLGWRCIDLDECIRGDHTCDPNAECWNIAGSFECRCKQGYHGNGQRCLRPCRAHEECHQWAECAAVDGFSGQSYCQCRGWYVGDGVEHCGPPGESAHVQHTQAAGHLCDGYECDRHADCMPSPSGGQECVCQAGFHGNGVQCERLITAEPEQDRRQPGRSGQDHRQPSRPDEPEIIGTVCRAHEECSDHGQCVYNNALGYYQCQCRPPYSGDGVRCFLEEGGCDKANNCAPDADCVFQRDEFGGAFLCLCKEGFSGDGYTCNPTRFSFGQQLGCDQMPNCHRDAQCMFDSGIGRHVCQCLQGYVGDGYSCEADGPPVSSGGAIGGSATYCREQTECHQNGHCVVRESDSAYVCECLPGFRGDGVSDCTPADECSPADSTSCPPNAECLYGDVERAYVCKCVAGFTGDGQRCDPHAAARSCDEDPRVCHANAQCTYNHQQADHVCVCRAGSHGDGYSSCTVVDTPRCNNCSQFGRCVQRSNGGWACECSLGYQGNGYLCTPLTTCLDDRSLCDTNADCVPGEHNFYICNCRYGYHGNGRTCTPDSQLRGETLLIGRGMAIIQRGLIADIAGKQVVVVPHQLAVGVDFDCQEERIVWSDISGHVIRSASLNGTDVKEMFAEALKSPEGIVVDWSSRNAYYTDSSKDEIGVVSLDGKYQKTLISEGLVNPRALAIDLRNRHLFYSDWHREKPIIGRVDLDGSNRMTFIDTDIHLPNGLVVLHQRRELCWVDAGQQRLACIGLDQRNRRVVYAPLEYPFGLTVHNEERFYWTDWKDNKVHSVSVYGEGYTSFQASIGGSGKVYGIAAVPDKCHGTDTECANNNGGCPYLCLPKAAGGVSCVCPENAKDLDGCEGSL
uniref:Nidogen-1 n=1 Tax=Plectus sambesii TaxID=2011161 RepID=A0A914VKD9_9BILA